MTGLAMTEQQFRWLLAARAPRGAGAPLDLTGEVADLVQQARKDQKHTQTVSAVLTDVLGADAKRHVSIDGLAPGAVLELSSACQSTARTLLTRRSALLTALRQAGLAVRQIVVLHQPAAGGCVADAADRPSASDAWEW